MILSGELCFRIIDKNKAALQRASTTQDFQDFLSHDEHPPANKKASLRDIGRAALVCHGRRIAEAALTKASVEAATRAHIALLDGECNRLLRELQRLRDVSDACLMQSVRQYFSIAKDEQLSARQKLIADSQECEVQRRQAKILRDVRIFAHHLYHETRGKITLSALPRDSAQFKRCKKAVKDNTSKHFMEEMNYQHIKVLSVLKLEHSLISDNLQKLAANVDTGKVKGLFCIVPKGGLHAFSTFGLHSPQSKGAFQELFQVQWFRIGGDGAPTSTSKSGLGGGTITRYSAEQLAKKSLEQMNHFNSTSKLRFSRTCTLSQLRDLPRCDLEEGVFIALCRVLVSRTRTINSLITTQDIMDAGKTDYDALYSSVNEEYVLLNPDFVLPEFVLLVYFTPQSKPQTYSEALPLSSSSSSGGPSAESLWVPRALVPSKEARTQQESGASLRATKKKDQASWPRLGEALVSNVDAFSREEDTHTYDKNDDNDEEGGGLLTSRSREKAVILRDVEGNIRECLSDSFMVFRNTSFVNT